jgi:hypothetical protein
VDVPQYALASDGDSKRLWKVTLADSLLKVT